MAQEEEILAKADEEIEEPEDLDVTEIKADGKLIVQEEMAEGHVSLHACEWFVYLAVCILLITHACTVKLFWSALGGNHPILFWVTFLTFIFGYHILASSQVGSFGHSFLQLILTCFSRSGSVAGQMHIPNLDLSM